MAARLLSLENGFVAFTTAINMGALPYFFDTIILNLKSGAEAVSYVGLDHKCTRTKYTADWESNKYLEFSVSQKKLDQSFTEN